MMFAGEATATFNPGPESIDGRDARTWSAHVAAVGARLRAIAPYAALELVMPGGSLMAVLLWLYRRQKRRHPNLYSGAIYRFLW
jgi:hypothetical protein